MLIGLLVIIGVPLFGIICFLLLRLRDKVRALQSAVDRLSQQLTNLQSGSVAVPPPLPAALTPSSAQRLVPPPLPPAANAAPAAAPRSAKPLDWEAFLGVKLFAWIGGFVLFLGLAFAISYAFENNLIGPGLRVTGGGIVGLALVAAGLLSARRGYHAPAFSLSATGVLVLYTATYAAHAYYALVPLSVATVLMMLITAGALLLAVHLDAEVVVVLGILGGFLTPPLLWTGGSNPVPLFGYTAVLNLGTAAVALHKRWHWLVPLAALATVVTAFAWLIEFFSPAIAGTARWVFLLFLVQFIAIALTRQRAATAEDWTAIGAAIVGFGAIAAAMSFAYAGDATVHSAAFTFPFLLLANAGLLLLVIARNARTGGGSRDWIAAIALLLTWTVELGWHEERLGATSGAAPLLWYVAILALYVGFPYFAGRTERWPWSIAAVAGPLQFYLVHRGAAVTAPSLVNGLLPAAFALPYLLGVWFLVQRREIAPASADQRLASQSGAALLFLSLIMAVQFEREWITLGWALEGVALLLLYRVVPNPQLRWTAVIVLCAAFSRLALNPAVWEYHPRTGVPIWNWYLYAYGITAGCLLVAAKLLGREHKYPSRLLYTLGTITAFLLLNIEIADYFSVGPTLTFAFTGNFGRDMTYSIAWALFAFALLLIGMRQKARAARYAGIALLLTTLAKLFLNDFANLGPLYRIGAFIAVAVILIVASFVYQRFLAPTADNQDAAA
jgi:uncharacterized membrane protein